MRNRLLIFAVVVLGAYALGTRARARESVAHQLVRLWNDPKARRRRERARRRAERRISRAISDVRS